MKGFFTGKITEAPLAVTFNDVVIIPGLSPVEPNEVDISTRATVNVRLNIPFISSPMETVTGSSLAIALARQGGLGVLHRNCSVDEEVEMAKQVKRAESFIIRDVVTVGPRVTVKEAIRLMMERDIHGLPVVDGDKLVGIVTWRDVRFADPNLEVRSVMTGGDRLVTAGENVTLDEAKEIMHKHRIEKLPIVDREGRLKGLITMRDLDARGRYPNAVRDKDGRLLCAAAVSPFDLERARRLEPYVDVIFIDVAHFHNENVIAATKKLVKEVSVDVVVGNIGTYQAAVDALSRIDRVAGLRVGIGSGSICVTSTLTKAAAPTLFATAQAADALRELGVDVPVIADGGIKNPGDVACALALGASAVMMGSVFAGCKESPSRLIALEGKYYKEHYGMGSHRAKLKRYALDRYSQPSKEVEEGVEGWVPYRGTVEDVVREFTAGLKAAMGYAGATNVREMWEKAKLAIVTSAGLRELGPHDVLVPGGGRSE